jgi:crotonobetainyl-CoA:carnitine CoA-transferase CaiB-like acyl-CoA transferase
MSLTGPAEGEPTRVGIAIVDIQAGLNAVIAILAALFARDRQKTGQRIDISLLDTQIGMLTYAASNFLVSGTPAKRYGNAHPNIVPYQSFKAIDGYLAFAAGNDLQWKRFCEIINRQDLSEDPRFITNPQRVTNRQALIAILEEIFATKSVEEWLRLCEKATVPAARINSIEQVFQDEQVIARNLQASIKLGDEEITMLNSPILIGAERPEIRYAPPQLGEHTEQVLAEVGYSEAEILMLREKQAI